jgi:MFS family permease
MRRDQSAFFASLFLSRLADQVLLFLVPLVVFQTTQSAAWSGVAFFVETLPRFVAFPVCGVLCDRFAVLSLMRWSQRGRALAGMSGFLCTFFISSDVTAVAGLVVLSAVCGVLTTQGVMAREVMLPQVFRHQAFVRVLARAQIADQLGMVLGPLVAAACLKLVTWQTIVGGTALLFLSADAFLALWRRYSAATLTTPEPAYGQSIWAPYLKAAAHVRRIPGLTALIALAAGVNLVVGVTLATGAAMVIGVHARSEADYAWLQTSGAVVTVAILVWIARARWNPLDLSRIGFLMMLAGGMLTAWGSSASMYMLGYLLVVGFDKMFSVAIRAERQRLIPAQDYGKTSGLMVLLNNLTQPLAGLAVGVWSKTIGTTGVIVLLSAAMAFIGLVVWVLRQKHSLTN